MPEFRPIPGLPAYEVGSDGTVRSYFIVGGNKPRIGTEPKILKPMLNRAGYSTVHLRFTPAKRKKVSIHYLVLLAFCGPRPTGYEACHNNGNPQDNRIENLRWGTPLENQRDSIAHGTKANQRAAVRRFTPDQVKDMRERFSHGESALSLADRFGCAFQTVYKIINRQRYAEIE